MSKGGKYILDQNKLGTIQDPATLNLHLLERRLREIRERECKSKIKPRVLWDIGETHNIFVSKWYKPSFPLAYEWTNEPINGSTTFNFGGATTFLFPVYGDFIGETLIYFQFSGLSTVSPLDKCGYYDFLGAYIMQQVQLMFNGNVIDQYYSDMYNVYYNYHVPSDKQTSWLRALGQEVPEPAILRQSSTDEYREQKMILNGPQTPKQAHDMVELWVPILFDFSMKPHCALFSAAIPFGQRILQINSPNLADLIFVEDNGGGGAVNLPTVQCSMWINQFFIHEPVVDDLKKRDYITTLRTFRTSVINATSNSSTKLDNVRLQVEDMYVGFRPSANINHDDWWRFHDATPTLLTFPVRIPHTPAPFDQLTFANASLIVPSSPFLSLFFTSRNVVLNNSAPDGFYNILQPLTKSISPNDIGLLMFTFAQKNNQTVFPTIEESDDITTYFNVSNEKEFYINYQINSTALPGTITIITRNLNWFFVRRGGDVEILYKN